MRLRKIRTVFLLAVLAIAWPNAADDEEFQKGKHYKILPQPKSEEAKEESTQSSGAIEVIEFFSYGCPLCYRFEKSIDKWMKKKSDNVTFTREHVIFNRRSIPYAKAYYLAEDLKILPKIHMRFFREIHDREIDLTQDSALLKLFQTAGKVDKGTFEDKFYSQETYDRVLDGHKQVRKFGVPSTPSLVVGERYLVTFTTAGRDLNKMFDIVDFLVGKIQESNAESSEESETQDAA